jgi:hypothetical protein
LQRLAARDDDTDGYCAVCVQPLVVLKISIVEGIFIVPFDLNSPLTKSSSADSV